MLWIMLVEYGLTMHLVTVDEGRIVPYRSVEPCQQFVEQDGDAQVRQRDRSQILLRKIYVQSD